MFVGGGTTGRPPVEAAIFLIGLLASGRHFGRSATWFRQGGGPGREVLTVIRTASVPELVPDRRQIIRSGLAGENPGRIRSASRAVFCHAPFVTHQVAGFRLRENSGERY